MTEYWAHYMWKKEQESDTNLTEEQQEKIESLREHCEIKAEVHEACQERPFNWLDGEFFFGSPEYKGMCTLCGVDFSITPSQLMKEMEKVKGIPCVVEIDGTVYTATLDFDDNYNLMLTVEARFGHG